MTDPRAEPVVTVHTTRPADALTELLVVPVFEQDSLDDPGCVGLDAASGGEIGRAMAQAEFRPKPNELFVTPLGEPWKAERVALVGVGPRDTSVARLRAAASAVAIEARRRRITKMAFMIRGDATAEDLGQAFSEGLHLGAFEDRRYKTRDDAEHPTAPLASCEVLTASTDLEIVERSVRKGTVIGTSANLARELSNEPANVLTPRVFADRALALVSGEGVDVEVLEEEAIRGLGMGLLLGVARGSVEPPRVIVMRHSPKNAADGPVLGLVGKGRDIRQRRHLDKAGGRDGPNEAGHGRGCCRRWRDAGHRGTTGSGPRDRIVPMTENMPGGRATKPGDILTGASGKTVEVLNTDAEGRLILGDALWYARELGATHLVDIATLTGACVVALGHAASGLFGRPSTWTAAVQRAAAHSGERVWPLPLYDEYTEKIRSEMADLVNTGGRAGGACTAAAFLQAFAGELPWSHIDIAGTAWADDARPDLAKGATGVMVRTLTELACMSQDWASDRPDSDNE